MFRYKTLLSPGTTPHMFEKHIKKRLENDIDYYFLLPLFSSNFVSLIAH